MVSSGMLLEPQPYFVKRGVLTMLVPEGLRKCAVFIGVMKGNQFYPRATGFLISYEDGQYRFSHLATAEHVVSGLLSTNQKIWMRVNLVGGGTGEYEIPPTAWVFHPDEASPTDVAILPLPEPGFKPDGSPALWDHSTIGLNGESAIAASKEVLNAHAIGVGEEVCVIGLFRSHYGRERNVPIVRVGNIAMLDGEPVHTKYNGFVEAYLIEARSIGGLSGSPVFVNMAPHRVVDGHVRQTFGPQFYLLGLMHGHFDITDLALDSVVDDARDASNGINTGVGVVIPVEKIVEAVNHPDLVARRREFFMAKRQEEGAIPDLAYDGDVRRHPEAERRDEDANPRHREDFTRLVSEAAKKRSPSDRT